MNLLTLRLVVLCSCLLLWPCGRPAAFAQQQPEIKDIIVTTSDAELLLFATVKNAFTPEMLDGVRNGEPMVFTFQLELVKTNSGWLDTTLVESSVTHTMTYDQDKKTYQVVLSDQNDQVVATQDLEQAKQLMAELNGVKVIELSRLVPDAPYAIHFKVTLKKGALPLGLQHIVPFLSFWDFETDWRTIEFRY